MKNFDIAGVPRSGSHFLAEVLNTSQKWTVVPEHPDDFGKKSKKNTKQQHLWITAVNDRLNKDYYGEVSPQHLKVLSQINVEKKVCVYRHPYDFLLSTFNRRNSYAADFGYAFNQWYMPFYTLIDKYIEEGMYSFKFEEMIKKVEIIQNLCDYLEIDDIDFSSIDLTYKVNSAESHKQPIKWKALTMITDNQFEKLKKLDWFCDKYYEGVTIQKRHEEKIGC
jgi:hypothetical protein